VSEGEAKVRTSAFGALGRLRIGGVALSQFALVLALCAFAGLLGLAALSTSARIFWMGELAANLRWQQGIACLLLAFLLVGLRRRKLGAIALVLSAVHAVPALALHVPPAEIPKPAGPELVVASSNLWYCNRDEDRLRAWLETDAPDVIAFSEVSGFWTQALIRQLDLYPHQVISPSPDLGPAVAALRKELENESPEILSPHESKWGLALLSRYPLDEVHVHDERGCPDAYIEADVLVKGARVQVIAMHPERPGYPPRTEQRNATLQYVAMRTRWREEAIVLGDLNVTVYSPAYEDFIERAGLADSRQGFGRMPTWNPPLELPGRWLDIDHILVRPGIAVMDRWVGPDIGSDHLPVSARVRVKRDPVAR
jgi:endonuclease/exonuclease/phosphatase (EEP) superfamily protein YafD